MQYLFERKIDEVNLEKWSSQKIHCVISPHDADVSRYLRAGS